MNLTELQEEYDKFNEDVSIFPSPSVGEYIGLDVRKPVFGLVNIKGSDQPALLRRLISAFVIHLLESTISKLASSEI